MTRPCMAHPIRHYREIGALAAPPTTRSSQCGDNMTVRPGCILDGYSGASLPSGTPADQLVAVRPLCVARRSALPVFPLAPARSSFRGRAALLGVVAVGPFYSRALNLRTLTLLTNSDLARHLDRATAARPAKRGVVTTRVVAGLCCSGTRRTPASPPGIVSGADRAAGWSGVTRRRDLAHRMTPT